jgi:hypothetical protein
MLAASRSHVCAARTVFVSAIVFAGVAQRFVPSHPRFASWRGARPPLGLAARVPIMGGGGDVEMCAARGGAPLVAAGMPVDPDSLSTHLAPLVMEESAFSLPAHRSWMRTCGPSAPAYGRRNSGGGRIRG